MSSAIATHRIWFSRALSLGLLVYLLFSYPTVPVGSWVDSALKYLGLVLLAAAAIGRIWCGVFISGYKDGELITTGPYSLSRNPLYVLSFLGGVGFGLAARNLYFSAALALLFILLYPGVVATEETRLRQLFGEPFDEYCKRVPRWGPKLSAYTQPSEYQVRLGPLLRQTIDASIFILAFILADVIYELHTRMVLPVYW
jgi:protein-S-isoprenylcysteine O-methyltransferase Ste14